MTPAEILSNIIATIALLLSVYGFKRDKNIEKRNHEFDLFRDIYQEHLVKKIPLTRSRITISNSGKVSGIDSLIDELRLIRKESIYFRYAEPEFYDKLRDVLWDLEDYLTLIETPLIGEARVNFDHEVNSRLRKIYKCLLKKF